MLTFNQTTCIQAFINKLPVLSDESFFLDWSQRVKVMPMNLALPF